MAKHQIFLDTDVIINWISKEVDKNTGFKLWRCPYEIMKLAEADEITACTALTNVFEIRYVLRRKMKYEDEMIKEFLNDNPLDPFDAIGLSIVQSIDSCILVSRDSDFIKWTEKNDTKGYVPEKFLQIYFPELFNEVKNDLY